MCVPLHVVVVLLCLVFGRPDQFSECFSGFSRPPLPFVFFYLIIVAIVIIIIDYYYYHYFHRASGSVWRVLGLWLGMAGGACGWLRVGQAFGVLLLPGLGSAAPAPRFLGTQPPPATQALNEPWNPAPYYLVCFLLLSTSTAILHFACSLRGPPSISGIGFGYQFLMCIWHGREFLLIWNVFQNTEELCYS